MAEQSDGWEIKWELLVADAWADPELKKRLIADPATVLKERGLKPPAGITLKVVESTESVQYLVLPPKPAGGELSEEQLESVAGGYCCGGCFGCAGCAGCGGCGGCGSCRSFSSGCRSSCRSCRSC